MAKKSNSLKYNGNRMQTRNWEGLSHLLTCSHMICNLLPFPLLTSCISSFDVAFVHVLQYEGLARYVSWIFVVEICLGWLCPVFKLQGVQMCHIPELWRWSGAIIVSMYLASPLLSQGGDVLTDYSHLIWHSQRPLWFPSSNPYIFWICKWRMDIG